MEIYIEEYQPFKLYRSLVKNVLQIVSAPDYPVSPIDELAAQITEQMHNSNFQIDAALRRQYYEYQELFLAMEAFLDFYLAGAMIENASLSQDQQSIRERAAERSRNHCRNFLITRKIE